MSTDAPVVGVPPKEFVGQVNDVAKYPERLATLQARDRAPVIGSRIANIIDAVEDTYRITLVTTCGYGFVVFLLDDAHSRLL
jgi:hypothetical protein